MSTISCFCGVLVSCYLRAGKKSVLALAYRLTQNRSEVLSQDSAVGFGVCHANVFASRFW